jgi:predicted secreted protein
VRSIVLKWVNQDLADFVGKIGDVVIENTPDKTQRALLGFAISNSVDILAIYTDDVQDNKAQVNEYFKAMVRGEEMEELVKGALLGPIMAKANASEDLKGFVEKALDFTFDAIRKD